MIKEALQFIVGLNKAEIFDINGEKYADKKLTNITPVVRRPTSLVNMDTLTSFVDYIKSVVTRDNLYQFNKLYVHIESPSKVIAFETDNQIDKAKTYICSANATLPSIDYGRYYGSEAFNILLQSRFCQTPQTKQLLSIVGNVKATDVQSKSDNGITQTVHTNKGVILQQDTALPNPVELAPFRTFIEVNQVVSPFIFRARTAKEDRSDSSKVTDIEFALFEADGGAWEIEAKQRLKEYLEISFKDTGVVILA